MIINPTSIYIPEEDQNQILHKVKEILNTGQLTLGSNTKIFESLISEYTSNQFVTAVSSGTSALEIVALSNNLRNQEVIIPSNTFVATATPFLRLGCKIKFADCDPYYGSITLEEVKKLHTVRTKAVVIVHIGGIIAPESLLIKKYCEENNLILIEDAAHAIGSSIFNQPAGTIGDAGTFSFYATKVVTSGEGGAITTKNNDMSNEFKIYRDQGKVDFHNNFHTHVGSNWRLSELNAVLGISQLERLNEFISKRQEVYDYYNHAIQNDRIKLVSLPTGVKSNWYKIMAILDERINRNEFKQKLAEEGVRCGGEVYNTPCHRQPIFKTNIILENTDKFANSHICLPVSASMSEDEISFVCETVNKLVAKY